MSSAARTLLAVVAGMAAALVLVVAVEWFSSVACFLGIRWRYRG